MILTRFKKAISFFLCLALAMTPVPRKVLGTELTKADAPNVKVEKPKIIGEVIEKREKNVKHFLNDDMSYTCLLYTSPSPRDRG